MPFSLIDCRLTLRFENDLLTIHFVNNIRIEYLIDYVRNLLLLLHQWK